MPASSAADVAKRMRQVGEATQKAQKISLQRAALAMKVTHSAEMMGDAPGGRLRNVGKNGGKLSVSYKLQGDSTAIVEAKGPWQILNNPANPHLIQGRAKMLKFAGNVFRGSVHHPGHRGKRTWEKAQPAAEKAGIAELQKTTTRAITEAFKG